MQKMSDYIKKQLPMPTLEGLEKVQERSSLPQHMDRRMAEIRQILLELAVHYQTNSVMLDLYRNELARLPKLPKTLLPSYEPKGFSPLGRPALGEIRSCLLCGNPRYIKRPKIKRGEGLLCINCHRQHSLLRVKQCPRCNGSFVRERKEVTCLSCGFSRPCLCRIEGFYIVQLN